MTFKRFLGIGIATIICGLCAVGWADVKPIDPAIDCQKSIVLTSQSNIAKILDGYKTNATFTNGQYIFCFDQTVPFVIPNPIVLQPIGGDTVVIYGLKIQPDLQKTTPIDWTGKALFTVSGSNVLLQNVQITGPGSNITGSIGVALSGSGHAIINSTISGFATANNISGTNATIQNSTLTGSSNIVAGTMGIAMSGSGHTVTANTITGFETGVKAECSPAPQPPPLSGRGSRLRSRSKMRR